MSRSECDGAMEGGRPNMVGSSGRTPPRPGVQSRAYPPHPPPPPPPDAATMALHLSQVSFRINFNLPLYLLNLFFF